MIEIRFVGYDLLSVPEGIYFSDLNLCEDSETGELTFELDVLESVLEVSGISNDFSDEIQTLALILTWYKIARSRGEPVNSVAEGFVQAFDKPDADEDHSDFAETDPLVKYDSHRIFDIPPEMDHKYLGSGYALVAIFEGQIVDIKYFQELLPSFNLGYDAEVDPETGEDDYTKEVIDSWFDLSVISRAMGDYRLRWAIDAIKPPHEAAVGAITGLKFVQMIDLTSRNFS